MEESSRERRVYVADLRGSINPGGAAYLERVLELARGDESAEAVLIRLDTPGGLLSSTRQMIQLISKSRVPVLVYVGPSGASATSAGAILLVSSHGAGMSPGTNVGAAHPVGSKGEDIGKDLREKAVNDTVAMMKSMAEERGRPVDLAEKMVRSSSSYTAREALENHLIDAMAEDSTTFLRALDGRKVHVEGAGREVTLRLQSPILVPVEMSWGQKLLHFLADPNIAAVLMSLGTLLIYVEVMNPGITIVGVLGGVCLIAGFMSFQLLPIRTGGLLLLLLGLIMLVVEAFTPTHGALALGGLISLVLGILWVMDPSGGALQISPSVWIPTVVLVAGVVVLLGWAAARSRRLVERTLRQMKGSGYGGLEGYSGTVDSVHPQDRQSGTAVFRGEIWSIRSISGELELGEVVKVVEVEGLMARVVPERQKKQGEG
jgi:membrane-bound serine protease (ClpP class)